MPLDSSRQKQIIKPSAKCSVVAHACFPTTQEGELEGSKPACTTKYVLGQLELQGRPCLNKTIAKMKPKSSGKCHKLWQLKEMQQTVVKLKNKEINRL